MVAADNGSNLSSNDGLSEQAENLSLATKTTKTTLSPSLDPGATESIPPHLSHDPKINGKCSDPFQFGKRFLEQGNDIFEFNAWDHVEPDDEHISYSETQYALQRASPVSEFDRNRFNKNPEKWWDLFYKQRASNFFKDRKWLLQEFPILRDITRDDAGPKLLLEVGAGAGNTAFPILRLNENPDLRIVAADYSRQAVETMRNAEDYPNVDGRMQAEVWDAAGDTLPEGIEEGTVDVVIMIFIFSALNPRQWAQAVRNVWRVLRPGGRVLFRDYGRGDLAQVRFKTGRWMEENFYVRGDGTRVYFFEKDELEQIWSGSYFDTTSDVSGVAEGPPRFEILNLDVDRRLIVNRQRRIKMYRCWMQGHFQKPMKE